MKQVNSLKSFSLMCLTAILFSTVSCKKETIDTVPPVIFPAKKLKQVSDSYDGQAPDITKITYDATGRIATLLDRPTETDYFDYQSPTMLVITTKKNIDNSVKQIKECTINDKGYISKMVIKVNAVVNYTYEYTYNVEGYTTKVKGYNAAGSGFETEYTYVNGSPASFKKYNDGVQTSTGQYIYDETKLNKMPFPINFNFPSYNLFGKPVKYILKEYKQFDMSSTLIWHLKNSSEFDAEGYLKKQTTDYVLQGKQNVADYIVE